MKSNNSLIVLLFLSIFLFGVTNVSTLTAASNTTIAPHFGVGAEKMAALSTAYFLAAILGALLSGYLADLLGRKRLILTGGTLLAVGLVLFGYCRHLILGEITQFFIGAGGLVIEVVATVTICDLCRKNPARALNLSQVFFGAGAFISPLLVGYLLGVRGLPWPGIYFGAAILMVLLVFGLMLQTFPNDSLEPQIAGFENPKSVHQEDVRQTRSDVRRLLTDGSAFSLGGPETRNLKLLNGTFLALILAMFAYGCAEMGTAYSVPPFLEKGLGATKRIAGVSLSSYWGLMMVGRLVGAGMPQKISYPGVIAWSCAAGAVCLTIASAPSSATVAGLSFALMGLSIAMVWPTILADASRRIERHHATAFGIIIGFGALGSAAYPLVVGKLAEASGWHVAVRSILIPLAVIPLVFAVFYALDRLRKKG